MLTKSFSADATKFATLCLMTLFISAKFGGPIGWVKMASGQPSYWNYGPAVGEYDLTPEGNARRLSDERRASDRAKLISVSSVIGGTLFITAFVCTIFGLKRFRDIDRFLFV